MHCSRTESLLLREHQLESSNQGRWGPLQTPARKARDTNQDRSDRNRNGASPSRLRDWRCECGSSLRGGCNDFKFHAQITGGLPPPFRIFFETAAKQLINSRIQVARDETEIGFALQHRGEHV